MASLSLNSKITYSSGEKRFLQFCIHLKLNPAQALPASESTIIYFAGCLAKTLKIGTIKTYLAGVRNMHIPNGYNLLLRTFIRLQYVLCGIKRVQGVSKRVRLPITIHHLAMFDLFSPRSRSDNKMIWAAFTLALFGFLRISEFTCNTKFNPKLHLTSSDIKSIPSPTFSPVYESGNKGLKNRSFLQKYAPHNRSNITEYLSCSCNERIFRYSPPYMDWPPVHLFQWETTYQTESYK